MRFSIPQNPSKPTLILNITGKMAIVLVALLLLGIGLAFLVNAVATAGTAVEEGKVARLPDLTLIGIAVCPAVIYLILFYPLPDGRTLYDWLTAIKRFYGSSQTYYYRRTQRD